MTSGFEDFLVVAGSVAAQASAYLLLVRFAFGLSWRRSAVAMIARIVAGTLLTVVALFVRFSDVLAVILLVTSPVAWALTAPIDPRRSVKRFALWVVVGTAVSLAVNCAYFGVIMGDDYFHPVRI